MPTTNATAVVGGRPASLFSVPPESPRGSVRVASYGFARLQLHEDTGAPDLSAVHVRLIVDDDSDAGWWLDTREQRLDLKGHGQSVAAYAAVDRDRRRPS